MAFDLNPLAVTAAPLLRAIQAGNWNTRGELAQAAGRLQNHIARDIGSLVKAGLAEERDADACGRPIVLTDDGVAQLAALDRAADPNAAGALTALHSDLEPHPLNPRKDFETADAEEALDELRISIVKSGLLQPIVVRPKPEAGKWWIVAGERRWRAIGQAISDGDWEEDRPIEITAREVDDRDHLLLALNENLQRSNMSAIEEGVAFGAAVNDFGLSTEELANRTGKSQRYVQQRIALLKLDQVDQDRMRLPRDHPDRLSFKAARAMTQTPRASAADDAADPLIASIASEFCLPDTPWEVESEVRYGRTIGLSDEVIRQRAIDKARLQPPPSIEKIKLTDRQVLTLVEVCHAVENRPSAHFTAGKNATDVIWDRFARDPATGSISGLIEGLLDDAVGASGARLSTKGHQTLVVLGLHPLQQPNALYRARCAAGHDAAAQRPIREAGRYFTAWLNPADPADAAAPPAMPEPETTREPGSPADAAARFGRSLTDREALAFVEIVDKAERYPATDPALAAEGYTEVADARDAVRDNLVQKGLIAIRYRGGERPHARAYLAQSGGRAWLEEIGFDQHRSDVLFEFRARVHGAEDAARCHENDRYATTWLNPGDPAAEPAETISGANAPSVVSNEPEQPELIEATEDEKAERERRRQDAADRQLDEQTVDWFAAQLKAKLAVSRSKGRRGWNDPAACTPASLAFDLLRHVDKGDPLDIATYAMFVLCRGGAVYAQRVIAFAADPTGREAPDPDAMQALERALAAPSV